MIKYNTLSKKKIEFESYKRPYREDNYKPEHGS